MPKTVKEIAEDFYYDSYVEDHPSDHRPCIFMDPANPYFESKRGRLYRKGGRKPYI